MKDVLSTALNFTNQARGHLLENKPIQAYNSLKYAIKYITKTQQSLEKLDDGALNNAHIVSEIEEIMKDIDLTDREIAQKIRALGLGQ